MAKEKRWSPTTHVGVGSGVAGLNPIGGLVNAGQHELGEYLSGEQTDRSLGSYMGKSALGGAASLGPLGAGGGALAAFLVKHPEIAKMGNIKKLLLGIGGGGTLGALTGGLAGGGAGIAGKVSDLIGDAYD